MAQPVKGLLCKPEDLGLTPRILSEKLSRIVHAHNARVGEGVSAFGQQA